MSRPKRPFGVIAGPIVLVLGMAIFWGAQSAMAMKEQVMDWSYQLEYSPEPVVMHMPNVPVVPPLMINNDRMGRIDMVVVQRSQPGHVDSITIMAEVPERYRAALEDCHLRLRVPSMDLHGYTRALMCTSDTDGLVTFGHLNVLNSDIKVPILMRSEDLPCDHHQVHGTPCGKTTERFILDLRSLQRELHLETDRARVEAHRSAEEARREAQRIRTEVRQQVRESVRSAVRGIR